MFCTSLRRFQLYDMVLVSFAIDSLLSKAMIKQLSAI